MKQTILTAACLLLLAVTAAGTAAAANNTTSQMTPVPGSSNQDGGTLNIGEEFERAIASVLMDLVEGLAETLNSILVRIFVSYPDVTASWLLDIHQKVFRVSLALASAAAAWIGLMHMFNRIDGVRPLISLLGAVAFGAVAPDLLYYPVELSRLTTEALAPANSELIQVSRFTFELLLVLFFDVFLLLGTVMIFVARDVFLMTGIVLAPLIALMAVTPAFRRASGVLTSTWIGCLIIGPVDAVVLDIALSLMGSSVMDTPHYLWGLGAIALLFGLPLILIGAGAVFFAPMTRVVSRGASRLKSGVEKTASEVRGNQESRDYNEERGGRRNRGNRFRRRRGDD